MNIFQRRLFQTAEETISILYLDGKFACWILEDQYRAVKVWGDTRIPAGKYKLELRKEGRQHIRYKKKFSFHKGMIHLMNVLNFKYIHFHIGNTEKDTAGCLIAGNYPKPSFILRLWRFIFRRRYVVAQSTIAYKRTYTLIADAILAGDTYWEIEDEYK